MAMFQVTVQRSFRIQAPVATRNQRLLIGNAAIAIVTRRVQAATDTDDSPAKPLSSSRAIMKRGRDMWSYAVEKQHITGRRGVRDWTYSGDMLKSLRVSIATTTRILISPSGTDSKGRDNTVKLAHNQTLCEMFGLSPSDEAKVKELVDALYRDLASRLVTESTRKIAAFTAGDFFNMDRWLNGTFTLGHAPAIGGQFS
jgi:hypothetical protein